MTTYDCPDCPELKSLMAKIENIKKRDISFGQKLKVKELMKRHEDYCVAKKPRIPKRKFAVDENDQDEITSSKKTKTEVDDDHDDKSSEEGEPEVYDENEDKSTDEREPETEELKVYARRARRSKKRRPDVEEASEDEMDMPVVNKDDEKKFADELEAYRAMIRQNFDFSKNDSFTWDQFKSYISSFNPRFTDKQTKMYIASNVHRVLLYRVKTQRFIFKANCNDGILTETKDVRELDFNVTVKGAGELENSSFVKNFLKKIPAECINYEFYDYVVDPNFSFGRLPHDRNLFNRWEGHMLSFPTENLAEWCKNHPMLENVKLLLDHILKAVCSPSAMAADVYTLSTGKTIPKTYLWVLSWMKKVVLGPFDGPIGSCLILNGPQGGGKTHLAKLIWYALGERCAKKYNGLSEWNDQYNHTKVGYRLAFIDELEKNAKVAERDFNKLKDEINGSTISQCQKYKDNITAKNFLCMILCTNNGREGSIHLEKSDRRNCVFEVVTPDGYTDSTWRELHKFEEEWKKDVPTYEILSLFYAYLSILPQMNPEYAPFWDSIDVSKPPMTSAKNDIQQSCYQPWQMFLESIYYAAVKDPELRTIKAGVLFDKYKKWCVERNEEKTMLSSMAFGSRVKAWNPKILTQKRTNTGVLYLFTPEAINAKIVENAKEQECLPSEHEAVAEVMSKYSDKPTLVRYQSWDSVLRSD